jgi:hypothetical protein
VAQPWVTPADRAQQDGRVRRLSSHFPFRPASLGARCRGMQDIDRGAATGGDEIRPRPEAGIPVALGDFRPIPARPVGRHLFKRWTSVAIAKADWKVVIFDANSDQPMPATASAQMPRKWRVYRPRKTRRRCFVVKTRRSKQACTA